MTLYDADFYRGQIDGSHRSANVVLKLVADLLEPKSLCDVGCGAGTWVKAALACGIDEAIGIDGAYARPSLVIPPEHFIDRDLRQPLSMDRHFDIAISMEVAEHLPPARSESFVADLTRLAPAVLFSAAIPNQDGVDHINERWQSWWVEAFARHGFVLCDVVRPQIWNDATIEVWYRQNAMLFVSEDHPRLEALTRQAMTVRPPVSCVHPELFPLGGMANDKVMLLKLFYWALRRDLRRLRARVARGG